MLRNAALGLLLCASTGDAHAGIVRRTGSSLSTVNLRTANRADSLTSAGIIRSESRPSVQAEEIEESEKHSANWATKPYVVEIFYEALCPDSARLLANPSSGLWSSYNARKDKWRFDLYPYGNAHQDKWNNTVCQHGTEECKGNLLHQCALQELPVQEAFALIDCLMGQVKQTTSGGADCSQIPPVCLTCEEYTYCMDMDKRDENCHNSPAHCEETCGAFAHCKEAEGARYATARIGEVDCRSIPAICDTCHEFAYCMDTSKQDANCANAPAHCAEKCGHYAQCMGEIVDCNRVPPVCHDCANFTYCLEDSTRDENCTNMPDHCQQDCGPFAKCIGSSLLEGQSGPEWAYHDAVEETTSMDEGTISNYDSQVASPCFDKLHRPDWRAKLLPCINNGSTQAAIQAFYEEQTLNVNFSWVPAVFINGTFNFNASHSGHLLSFLH